MLYLNLCLKNILYFWKQNLVSLTGIIISGMVITGALVIGDSVRYSLFSINERRLGTIAYSVHAQGGFFGEHLADSIRSNAFTPASPVIISQGVAVNPETDKRINQVQVVGIDESFPEFWDRKSHAPDHDEVYISENTADKLGILPGQDLVLKIRKENIGSYNTPFTASDHSFISKRFSVTGIAHENEMGRFDLKVNQVPPYTVFIARAQLADLFDCKGRINYILLGKDKPARDLKEAIQKCIQQSMTLQDVGLNLKYYHPGKEVELVSEDVFIHHAQTEAVCKVSGNSQEFICYMANEMRARQYSTPYSFVCAAPETYTGIKLEPDEILINTWLASDLMVSKGDQVELKYYVMGAGNSLKEQASRFTVREVRDISDPIFDRNLMPSFQGMTNAGNCRDWETGTPIDLDKIRKKDEEYWKEFKGTPKAFIALETGRYLWKNAIGDATSIRISRGKQELEKIRERILDDVRTRAQFVVEPVAENSRQASKNSVDFSGLFLSLSIFVILSGVLLSFTIVSFLAASRRRETAVYASLGFEKQLIVKILISEVLLLAAIALIPGLLMGILFNKLMIHLLNTVWMGAVGISSLQILVSPGTLLLSAIIGFLISATTFTTVVIRNLRKNPAGLIKSPPQIRNIKNKKILLFRAFYLICIIIALISILLSVIFSWKANPVVALLIGGILMTGLLLFIYTQFTIQKIIPVQPLQGVWHQIQRNLSARRNRSLAAIALLTIGTYTILITGSNYRTEPGSGKRDTGTGGFLLWMESAIPIPWDLNSPAGITKAGLEDIQLTDSVQIYQLTQVSSGDASCLNLNQVTTPTLTGIPTRAFDSLKAFSFSRLSPALKKKSPWLSLDRSPLENIIPAFADQTVITWGLKRNIGDTLMYQAENSKMVKVVLMGGLENSIFQGRILVSDSLLRVYFPASSEPGPMLIDAPDYKESYLTEAFEQHFRDFGLSAIPAVTRLNSFNVVQNTYLQVFLVLGGIGIIIGIFGLGIILLKNIFDSRKEIALYQAIGINSRFIFKLIAFENLYLLLAGLAVGLISSAAGMIMLPGTILMHLPWSMMATMILLILITGLAWISIPTKIVMKQHLIPNLRKE